MSSPPNSETTTTVATGVYRDTKLGLKTWRHLPYVTRRPRVFENRVLRRIFGAKRDEVTGDWRKLHNEELHNSYSSSNRMIKSRRIRWAGHVERMGRRGMHIGYWWGSQKVRDH
jgi:hypothetical protein